MLNKLKEAIPNPLRLTFKLFILVWVFLILQVVLKVTFNYWQPYVIPTDSLELVGNYIDSHKIIQYTLNAVLYFINVLIMLLCGVQQWWFKSKKELIIYVISTIICYVLNITLGFTTITSIYVTILLPLIINKKKWLWILLTFGLSYVFLRLSLWFEGFVSAENMNYIVRLFLNNDYYIMLILNYILFNFIRIKKEMK